MNAVSQDEAFAYVIATQLELTLCGWNFVSPMCYLFICYVGDLKLCGGTSQCAGTMCGNLQPETYMYACLWMITMCGWNKCV